MMPYPAGRAFPLTGSDGDDRWPTWSADGDKLLFHRLADRGQAIRSYDRETGKLTQLVGAGEKPGPASFDPTGTRIVYVSRCCEGERLRIRNLTTGAVTNLETPGEASFPRWSPDGRRIAFAMRRGLRWDVATLQLSTSEVRVWTNGEARGVRDVLNWSPDGRYVVYHASTQPFEADVYIVDTVSGRTRNLTRDHHFSQAPAFTNDGSGITFMSTRGGNWTWGFYRLNLASNEYKLLLGPDYIEKNYPTLTGDGELIWSEFDTDGREYLALRGADGRKRLLKEAGSFARWPSASADGKKILYTTIDHNVEYWIAEGLNGAGSPLLSKDRQGTSIPARARPDGATSSVRPDEESPNRSQRRASPVQLHHR
jgi:TolB protein